MFNVYTLDPRLRGKDTVTISREAHCLRMTSGVSRVTDLRRE